MWGLNNLQLLQVSHLQIEPGLAPRLHCRAQLSQAVTPQGWGGPRLELLSWWVWL